MGVVLVTHEDDRSAPPGAERVFNMIRLRRVVTGLSLLAAAALLAAGCSKA
jgi:hypothetical protein